MERVYCNSENAKYCSTSSSIKYILHIVMYLPVNAYGTLHHLSEEKSANGAGIAQMVEHSTEKPGADAIRTWFESPVQQTFAPSVNFHCRLSYCHTVSIHYTAPCVHWHASTSVHTLKVPNADSHTFVCALDMQTYCTHLQEWVALLLLLLRLTQLRRSKFP